MYDVTDWLTTVEIQILPNFFSRFATMLFLSYKLVTNKISIELIKHSNTKIAFKQIYIL